MDKNLAISVGISAIFLFVPSALAVLSSELARHYLPALALALGAAAIAIGIQQLYISNTILGRVDGERVYFWGALSLFGFGTFSIIQMLQVFQLLNIGDGLMIKRIELAIFFLSFMALFRAVSALLYRRSGDYIGGLLGFAQKTPQRWATVFVWIVNPFAVGWVLLAPPIDVIEPIASASSDAVLYKSYLQGLKVEDYFPLAKAGFPYLMAAFIMNYLCLLFIFSLYVMQRVQDKFVDADIPFFVATIKLFLLLPLTQMVFLALGIVQVENATYFTLGIFATAFLICFFVFAKLGPIEQLAPLKWAMVIGTGVIPLFFWWQTNMFLGFPVFYIGLAFLTLGFAYLPAQKIRDIAATEATASGQND